MSALVEVILPVFLVIGFGYVLVWRKYLTDQLIDNLMTFAQTIAVPCLLFKSVASLDLAQNFDWRLMVSFYSGATAGFVVGMLGARFVFGRPWEDSVAIGFIGLFSNSLLLGVPITERAYGADALSANFAIIAIHSPYCYIVGISVMEIVRNRGGSIGGLPAKIAKAVFRNAMIIGIMLGLTVNLTGFPLPQVVFDAVDLLSRAAIPAALFALGGVLYRLRPEGDMGTILMMVCVSLVLHPAVTWLMGKSMGLDLSQFRSAVLTASMAPGVNAYLFANMYGVAKRVAASSVLYATAGSILTVWAWLAVLP